MANEKKKTEKLQIDGKDVNDLQYTDLQTIGIKLYNSLLNCRQQRNCMQEECARIRTALENTIETVKYTVATKEERLMEQDQFDIESQEVLKEAISRHKYIKYVNELDVKDVEKSKEDALTDIQQIWQEKINQPLNEQLKLMKNRVDEQTGDLIKDRKVFQKNSTENNCILWDQLTLRAKVRLRHSEKRFGELLKNMTLFKEIESQYIEHDKGVLIQQMGMNQMKLLNQLKGLYNEINVNGLRLWKDLEKNYDALKTQVEQKENEMNGINSSTDKLEKKLKKLNTLLWWEQLTARNYQRDLNSKRIFFQNLKKSNHEMKNFKEIFKQLESENKNLDKKYLEIYQSIGDLISFYKDGELDIFNYISKMIEYMKYLKNFIENFLNEKLIMADSNLRADLEKRYNKSKQLTYKSMKILFFNFCQIFKACHAINKFVENKFRDISIGWLEEMQNLKPTIKISSKLQSVFDAKF